MNNPTQSFGAKYYRWLVFILLAVGYLFVNFHRLCPAVVAVDLMKDLNAGGGLVGLLASAYFYPYALMQIPSGLLSDTWGPRKTITSFFILAGFASVAFGFAWTSGWAIVARVLVGIGVSMYFIPIMKILTHWFSIKEFSFMTGLLIAAGGMGALSAASPLAYLSAALGWRGSFVVIGVVTFVTAGAIWTLVRNSPEELGYPSVRDEPATDAPQKKSMGLKEGLWFVVRSPRFYPLAIWYFCTFGIFYSFGGLWGGPFLMDVYHMSKQKAGLVLSMFAVAIIVGSPAFSYVSDRILHSRKKAIVISSACMLLLCILLTLFTASFSVPMLYVWGFFFGVFGCAVSVIGFAASKESFPLEITGTAMGLINGFPFYGGAIAQPVIGYILDRFGKGESGYPPEAYTLAFWLYIALAVVALIAACCIKETFPHKTADSA